MDTGAPADGPDTVGLTGGAAGGAAFGTGAAGGAAFGTGVVALLGVGGPGVLPESKGASPCPVVSIED